MTYVPVFVVVLFKFQSRIIVDKIFGGGRAETNLSFCSSSKHPKTQPKNNFVVNIIKNFGLSFFNSLDVIIITVLKDIRTRFLVLNELSTTSISKP